MYITFIGGLFTFSSIVFTYFCNWVVLENISWPCLTFLESAGILSFFYIAFFSIKFGFSTKFDDNVSDDKKSESGQSDAENENISIEERERLKQELAKNIRMN